MEHTHALLSRYAYSTCSQETSLKPFPSKRKNYIQHSRPNRDESSVSATPWLEQTQTTQNKHNFLDTPTDICLCKNGVENTEHYLFKCKFYATHRAKLAASVINILAIKNNMKKT